MLQLHAEEELEVKLPHRQTLIATRSKQENVFWIWNLHIANTCMYKATGKPLTTTQQLEHAMYITLKPQSTTANHFSNQLSTLYSCYA